LYNSQPRFRRASFQPCGLSSFFLMCPIKPLFSYLCKDQQNPLHLNHLSPIHRLQLPTINLRLRQP
jgi:hypothetical protein